MGLRLSLHARNMMWLRDYICLLGLLDMFLHFYGSTNTRSAEEGISQTWKCRQLQTPTKARPLVPGLAFPLLVPVRTAFLRSPAGTSQTLCMNYLSAFDGSRHNTNIDHLRVSVGHVFVRQPFSALAPANPWTAPVCVGFHRPK